MSTCKIIQFNFHFLFSASTKTHLFQRIIEKYETIQNTLNSRTIREITFNLNASKYIMPSVCENIMNYIVDNKDYVLGDTVEKALYCCYNLGYVPLNDDAIKSSIEIINRDFNYMSGLAIVQACLALTFYKALPMDLINRVFNIDFIKRIEDEIQLCYSKVCWIFPALLYFIFFNNWVSIIVTMT